MKISHILYGFILGIVLSLLPCYLCALSGYGSFGGITEQLWLDKCIDHLRLLRANCNDPELQGVLDYTTRRYNQIGPFDVAVTRLLMSDAIACNNPMIPGISIDLDELKYSVYEGAKTVFHEALHDYWPYLGHSHITPLEEKLNQLDERIRKTK